MGRTSTPEDPAKRRKGAEKKTEGKGEGEEAKTETNRAREEKKEKGAKKAKAVKEKSEKEVGNDLPTTATPAMEAKTEKKEAPHDDEEKEEGTIIIEDEV